MRLCLTREEQTLLLESLEHAKLAFTAYQFYPSEEYRKVRIREVETLIAKVRDAIQEKKRGAK